MRKMPEFKTLQEPVPIINIDRHTTTTQTQTKFNLQQILKSQAEENY